MLIILGDPNNEQEPIRPRPAVRIQNRNPLRRNNRNVIGII